MYPTPITQSKSIRARSGNLKYLLPCDYNLLPCDDSFDALVSLVIFFFNDPATTEIYTLSLTRRSSDLLANFLAEALLIFIVNAQITGGRVMAGADRKSTRLNSSHVRISYAVFCLKK